MRGAGAQERAQTLAEATLRAVGLVQLLGTQLEEGDDLGRRHPP